VLGARFIRGARTIANIAKLANPRSLLVTACTVYAVVVLTEKLLSQ
jgi:hypothetical protein